jgi:hypothetical protein
MFSSQFPWFFSSSFLLVGLYSLINDKNMCNVPLDEKQSIDEYSGFWKPGDEDKIRQGLSSGLQ